jgi:dTDP-glucose 4,6-dehydratase
MTNPDERIVLVTGGAGFIGSNYLNYAVREHPTYKFVNVDALTYAADPGNLEVSDARNYAFEQADIRDKTSLTALFEKHRPTHVIHFAAESHVDASIKSPDIFIETNVLGTHNLLVLAKGSGVKRFHHISTDEVYGSLGKEDVPVKESAPILPNSPYSASKASSDLLVRAYQRTFGLDTVISRSSNAYGPRQYEEKIIPLFLKNLLTGKKVPLYGDGANMREWLYVDDLVKGIDLTFHAGHAGEIYNLGASVSLSNLELTKKILGRLGLDESRIERVPDRSGHDFRYAIDSSKAKQELGWEPVITIEEGLTRTIDYYRKKFGA